MPAYHFSSSDDATSLQSDILDVDDLAAAKCAAIKLAGQTICDASDTFWDRAEWTMTVSDPSGLTLFQITIVGIEAPAIA